MEIAKVKKALGKKRMEKVACLCVMQQSVTWAEDIMAGVSFVRIQLTNGAGNLWDFGGFTESEIIMYAKAFIDDGGHP
jgi:hypothetical protein